MTASISRVAGLCVAVSMSCSAALAQDVTGAGATFPAPLYAKWADAYNKATGARINYQSVGSGAGLRQIRGKTVDFGASDMPLTDEELQKDGLVQFPTVIGGVVPVVNIKGSPPGQLKLTGAVLGDIYLGKVTKWNDAAITGLNPGVALPDDQIQVVRRADGSGTSFIFTNYLSKVNPEWKSKVGEGTAVNWPTGAGGKGNEGVAAFVQRQRQAAQGRTAQLEVVMRPGAALPVRDLAQRLERLQGEQARLEGGAAALPPKESHHGLHRTRPCAGRRVMRSGWST